MKWGVILLSLTKVCCTASHNFLHSSWGTLFACYLQAKKVVIEIMFSSFPGNNFHSVKKTTFYIVLFYYFNNTTCTFYCNMIFECKMVNVFCYISSHCTYLCTKPTCKDICLFLCSKEVKLFHFLLSSSSTVQ